MYQTLSYNHLPVFHELFRSAVFVTDSLTAHFNYPNQNSGITEDKHTEEKGTVLTPVFLYHSLTWAVFCSYGDVLLYILGLCLI